MSDQSVHHNRGVAKKRGRETAYDMILSMGVVSLFVLVVLLVTLRPEQEMTNSVDYQGAISNAVATSNWPIYIPNQIPTGLTVSSARLEAESYGDAGDSRWYLGFTGTNGEFISLWQSDGSLAKVKAAATNNGDCNSELIIAGSTWQMCNAVRPETRALVKTDGELISVVSGTVDWKSLENFVNSLVVATK